VRDPRAAVFEREVERLAQSEAGERLALARAVEHAAEDALRARHPERPLRANVEFFTAVLLEAVGLPREAFSPTFAVGRVAGWCAHYLEQRETGRLIRPASRYVGPAPAR
jgi:citrate synthase